MKRDVIKAKLGLDSAGDASKGSHYRRAVAVGDLSEQHGAGYGSIGGGDELESRRMSIASSSTAADTQQV